MDPVVEQSLETQVALLAQQVGQLTEQLKEFNEKFADAPARLVALEEFQKRMVDAPARLERMEMISGATKWVAGVVLVAAISAAVAFGVKVATTFESLQRAAGQHQGEAGR